MFNGAKTLSATLDGLATQSEGIELIAVDQGSTDDSKNILNSYASRIGIRIIDAPKNENWVQNTNLALSEASAPLCTLLHQDDVWMPGRSELLQEMVRQTPSASIWLHSAYYIDDGGNVIGRFDPPFGKKHMVLGARHALRRLLVQNTFALPAVMFPTQLAQYLGGLDEDLWYTADWDFWLRLCAVGPVAWSPEAKAGFRIHGSAQTLTGSRDSDGFKQQLAEPLNRHLNALEGRDRSDVEALALASNALNHWLAGAYHSERIPLLPVLGQLLKLGPRLWWPFFRDTRIVQRILPRLPQWKNRLR